MPTFHTKRGQLIISTSIFASFLLAGVGGWFAQNRITEAKIDDSAKEIRAVTISQGEDIAALKEAVMTIKTDNADIKKDIREILRAVK